MIRRLEEYEQALAEAIAAAPQPGMLAALWKRTAGGIPGGLTVYDCGSGVLLVTRRGAAVLLGEPGAASRREITLFAPFAGVTCLYTAEAVRLPAAQWKDCPLVWMAAPAGEGVPAGRTDGHIVYPLSSYSAAAKLICAQESEDVRNDFYAELCSRRNRGVGQVLAIGDRAMPDACAVCSGPIPAPVPAAEPVKKPTGLWQRLRARLQRPQPPEMVPTVYLSDVFVAPQYRGGGKGAALVHAALRRLSLPEETQQVAVYCVPEMSPFYEKLSLRQGGRLHRWLLKEAAEEEPSPVPEK